MIATVRTPESRRLAAEVMTRGFRLNLTILSLIALLVGLYLIFQALDASW
jgi:putative ABC transport system permease protein